MLIYNNSIIERMIIMVIAEKKTVENSLAKTDS